MKQWKDISHFSTTQRMQLIHKFPVVILLQTKNITFSISITDNFTNLTLNLTLPINDTRFVPLIIRKL